VLFIQRMSNEILTGVKEIWLSFRRMSMATKLHSKGISHWSSMFLIQT